MSAHSKRPGPPARGGGGGGGSGGAGTGKPKFVLQKKTEAPAAAAKKSLFDDDDDDGDGEGGGGDGRGGRKGEQKLRINEGFAQRFEERKKKEDLSKIDTKMQALRAQLEESDDSDASSEDEDAALLTSAVDDRWFSVLAAVQRGDPSIYETGKDFFRDVETAAADGDDAGRKSKSAKPVFLKDLVRERILKKMNGELPEVSDSDDEDDIDRKPASELTHVEEQIRLKREFARASRKAGDGAKEGGGGSGSDDDDGDLFTLRKKTHAEAAEEEREFETWRREEGMRRLEKLGKKDDVKMLSSLWEIAPDLDEDERFLRDFIINERWRETSDNYRGLPVAPTKSAKQQKSKQKKAGGKPPAKPAADDDESGGGGSDSDGTDGGGDGSGGDSDADAKPALIDSDSEEFEQAEEYERKYNFRFEEEGGTVLKTHPRVVEDSARRVDNKRKEARQAKKTREDEKRVRKEEELKRLKAIKRDEVLQKLREIQRISGAKTLPELEGIDLDAEFDADAHDRQMQQLFAADGEEYYYDGEEGDGGDDGGYGDGEGGGGGGDWEKPDIDDEFDPDDPFNPPELRMHLTERSRAKAAHDSAEERRVLDKFMEKFYQLDYQDLLGGDTPVRFRYRQVAADDYGIPMEVLLSADDRDLNRLVSLKKLAPYRDDANRRSRKRVSRAQVARLKTAILSEHPEGDTFFETTSAVSELNKAAAPTAAAAAAATTTAASSKKKARMGKAAYDPEGEDEDMGVAAAASGATATTAAGQDNKKKKKHRKRSERRAPATAPVQAQDPDEAADGGEAAGEDEPAAAEATSRGEEPAGDDADGADGAGGGGGGDGAAKRKKKRHRPRKHHGGGGGGGE